MDDGRVLAGGRHVLVLDPGAMELKRVVLARRPWMGLAALASADRRARLSSGENSNACSESMGMGLLGHGGSR